MLSVSCTNHLLLPAVRHWRSPRASPTTTKSSLVLSLLAGHQGSCDELWSVSSLVDQFSRDADCRLGAMTIMTPIRPIHAGHGQALRNGQDGAKEKETARQSQQVTKHRGETGRVREIPLQLQYFAERPMQPLNALRYGTSPGQNKSQAIMLCRGPRHQDVYPAAPRSRCAGPITTGIIAEDAERRRQAQVSQRHICILTNVAGVGGLCEPANPARVKAGNISKGRTLGTFTSAMGVAG